MGNRLVCCRLSWTSFTNSDEDVMAHSSIHPRFQFTNHAAFYPPLITPIQSHIFPHEDNYHRLLSYCQNAALMCEQDSTVQHISEREPEDYMSPSMNASKSTIFLRAVFSSIRQHSSLQRILKLSNQEKAKHSRSRLQRWSSCGSVYISDGCLAKPDSKLILHCISVAVCALIKSEKKRSKQPFSYNHPTDRDPLIEENSDQSPSLTSTYDIANECVVPMELYKEVYEIYDERVYPLFRSFAYCSADTLDMSDDSPFTILRFQQQILHFLNRLFSSLLLTAESAIVALVYLERLITGLEMNVVAWSWRRQLLSCILIACKVLDDQAVWNADYCQLLKDVHVEDLNDLERHTLNLLQFNTGVPPAVYARYYFDLLTLADLVAFSDLFSHPHRRRLTPRLARQFRILPASPDARTEQCLSAIGYAGGGGLLFDLPCPPPSMEGEGSDSKKGRRRGAPILRRQSFGGTTSLIRHGHHHHHQHRHHHHPPSAFEKVVGSSKHPPGFVAASSNGKANFLRDNDNSSFSSTHFQSPATSTASSSSTNSSNSSSSSTTSSASGYLLPHPPPPPPPALSQTAQVFSPWGVGIDSHCAESGNNSALYLLQQDSGLY